MSAIRFAVRIALLALLVIALVGIGVGAGVDGLESRLTSASDVHGMLPATQLTALPHPAIADGTASLRVRLSGRPASFSPRPKLSPAVAGTWTTRGDSEIFTPASTLDPCATYRLMIPAASTAVSHSPLGIRRTVTVQVVCPSVKGLQQTLASLDYLPYRAHSSARAREMRRAGDTGEESESETNVPDQASASETKESAHLARRIAAMNAFDPSPTALHARIDGAPSLEYGQLDETTKGAVMVFQAAHGIEPTGTPEAATWKALLKAAERHERSRDPYTFVTVTESIPETLEVHRGSRIVLSTPANTGVAGAETAQGIFPIFSHLTSTTMTGTNPDGSHYSDPGVPWVNYFNGGDAVHGFPRGSYGTPQSNGCVELPIETAHTVFEMLKIGDIVEITS